MIITKGKVNVYQICEGDAPTAYCEIAQHINDHRFEGFVNEIYNDDISKYCIVVSRKSRMLKLMELTLESLKEWDKYWPDDYNTSVYEINELIKEVG